MRRLLLVVVFALLAVPHLEADAYLHPRLAAGSETIRTVVLLPATAVFKAQGPRRSDIKEQEGELFAAAVTSAVSTALKKRGWEVNDGEMSAQRLADNEMLRWQASDIRERYRALIAQIKPKDVRKGKYSLGSRVAALGSWPEGTVLALVHADGGRYTSGGKAMNAVFIPLGIVAWPLLLFIPPDAKDTAIHVSLVDPKTGDVLCYLKTSSLAEDKILKELRIVP